MQATVKMTQLICDNTLNYTVDIELNLIFNKLALTFLVGDHVLLRISHEEHHEGSGEKNISLFLSAWPSMQIPLPLVIKGQRFKSQ